MLVDVGAIKKYAVYFVAAAAIVYNFGFMVANWWAPDNATIATVDTILGFLGLGTVRIKLADVFSGIDLGPVGTWITGKKTLILSVVGLAFNIGAAYFGLTANTPWVMFLNTLLGALGVGTFTSAMGVYKKEALKEAPQSNVALTKTT
jgi:hypothetical protein